MTTAAKKDAPKQLPVLTQGWAEAKREETAAHKVAEAYRAEILAAGAKIGYEDAHLVIGKGSKVEGVSMLATIENDRLERALKEEGHLESVTESRICYEKVKAIAKLSPRVARALEAITVETPRFEQVASKA